MGGGKRSFSVITVVIVLVTIADGYRRYGVVYTGTTLDPHLRRIEGTRKLARA